MQYNNYSVKRHGFSLSKKNLKNIYTAIRQVCPPQNLDPDFRDCFGRERTLLKRTAL